MAYQHILYETGDGIGQALAVADADPEAGAILILVAVPTAELTEKTRNLAARIARLPHESLQLNKAAIDKITEASGRRAGWLAAREANKT